MALRPARKVCISVAVAMALRPEVEKIEQSIKGQESVKLRQKFPRKAERLDND